MGTKRPARNVSLGLGDALFTRVQQRVLTLLFGQPERSYRGAELIRLADSGTGAVQRQLARLASAGWITVTTSGNQKHYQANPACPAFAELQGLVVKTVGLAEPVRRALASFAADIRVAFIYGSIAKRTDRATSDVDLLVVSDRLAYPDLFAALQGAEAYLGRTISPTVMTSAEWQEKRGQADSFVDRIVSQPKMFIIGTDRDLVQP